MPYVITIHGMKTPIAHGDYIVQEPDGVHYYPCKPDIFEKHYDLIEEHPDGRRKGTTPLTGTKHLREGNMG